MFEDQLDFTDTSKLNPHLGPFLCPGGRICTIADQGNILKLVLVLIISVNKAPYKCSSPPPQEARAVRGEEEY